VTAFDDQLDRILEARKAGAFYGFIISAASIGGPVDEQLEMVAEHLQEALVQLKAVGQSVSPVLRW